MLVTYLVFNHSGTLIKTFEVQSDIIPRVGEVISIEELDNTDKFIVCDVVHYPLHKAIEISSNLCLMARFGTIASRCLYRVCQ